MLYNGVTIDPEWQNYDVNYVIMRRKTTKHGIYFLTDLNKTHSAVFLHLCK